MKAIKMTSRFQKLKTLKDFETLTPPSKIAYNKKPQCPFEEQMVLRMLIRPKYSSKFFIPDCLEWLRPHIEHFYSYDSMVTGIHNKWCYVTVRHGIEKEPDNNWHLDGGSLRVELIPERNYIFVSEYGIEYKTGTVNFDEDFDPVKQNLFSYILNNISNEEDHVTMPGKWLLVHPFVFHRRSPKAVGANRTFIRITFPDIEIRDVNCTQNPLLPTDAFGRDPVKSFRKHLV